MPEGFISGFIFDNATSQPVANILVFVSSIDTNEWIATSTTDQNGHYSISISAGIYRVGTRVSSSNPNYVDKFYCNKYLDIEADHVEVMASTGTTGINFNMEKKCIISGRVVGRLSGHWYSRRRPVYNIHIAATGYESGVWTGSDNTDGNGYYTLSVPPGSYIVRTYADYTGLKYVDECFDNQYAWHRANPVSVTVASHARHIDFDLETGGTITGKVTDSRTSQAIVNLQVNANNYDTGEWIAGARTDASGNYSLFAPTGRYIVSTHAADTGRLYIDKYYHDELFKNDADPVRLRAPGNTPNIDFSLKPGPVADTVFINGRIVTMEQEMPQAEALAVLGKHILTVGTSEDIFALRDTDTRVIDLEGRALLPGFVDTHNHRFIHALGLMDIPLEEAQQIALEGGTTTMAESFTAPSLLEKMREFERQEKLRIRTSLYLIYNTNCGVVSDNIGDWYKEQSPITDPSAMLRIPGVKIFSDGGSCKRPAFSVDLPEWTRIEGLKGDLFIEEDKLASVISEIEEAGFQVAVHAMGDRAIETVLNAYETALAGRPNNYRHRIEHNSNIRPELLSRYGQLGIVPSMFGGPFSFWFTLPGFWWRQIVDMYGAVTHWINPIRSLMDANPGLHVVWQTDYPGVNNSGPIADLFGLVTRKERPPSGSGIVEPPGFIAAESVNVEEALRMMTIEAAYALFMEDWIGSLKPGKFADLIVLSDSPLVADPDSLIDLKVLLTMVGGRIEYEVEGLDPANIGGSVSGVVHQPDGIAPVGGALVEAYDDLIMRRYPGSYGVFRGSSVTDQQGHYKIDGLPTGRYAIRAYAAEQGYIDGWYQNTNERNERTRVSVTTDFETKDIDFIMEAGSIISGQAVVIEDGNPEPLINLSVHAVHTDSKDMITWSDTDNSGNYRLCLPAGSYLVRAFGPGNGLNYAPEWYDGVQNVGDATEIVVHDGEDIPNINFTFS